MLVLYTAVSMTSKMGQQLARDLAPYFEWQDGLTTRLLDPEGLHRVLYGIGRSPVRFEVEAATEWLGSLARFRMTAQTLADAAELSIANAAGGGDGEVKEWSRPAALKWLRDRGCPETTAHRLLNGHGPSAARYVWIRRLSRRERLASYRAAGMSESAARKRLMRNRFGA